MESTAVDAATLGAGAGEDDGALVCPHFHAAVELLGRRWTGAIIAALLQEGPLRFRRLAAGIPDLSDRLLAQRLRELEAHGMVTRRELRGGPVGVEYELTPKGRDLDAAVAEVTRWARHWLD
jgi:DNA-binding HxlR family transcriptional regulator